MDERGDPQRRSSIGVGILLIALGIVFLVARQLQVEWGAVGWPALVIVAGLAIFVLAFAVGGKAGAGFAVPAGIVTMTGAVLAVQNATGLWATWAYAWAVVAPFGVGLGLVVYGLLTRQREIARRGSVPLFTGLGLFLGFGAFFELVIGLSGFRIVGAETLLAVGLVALGVVLVVTGFVRRGRAT